MEIINEPEIKELDSKTVAYVSFIGNYIGNSQVFKKLFEKEPEIKAIHAGLECGILESKNPGMDMISFGPTIQNAHSPDERIEIKTVERFYELLKGILKEMANRN